MTSSQNDETKTSVSFFTALRRLGRELDQGVGDVQKQLSDQQKTSDTKRHLALKGIGDRKREMVQLKGECRTLLSDMRRRHREIEEGVQACTGITDICLQQLSAIHAHLSQYGFVPQSEDIDEPEEETENSTENVESGPPTQSDIDRKKRNELSPQLEDFGLSSFTLNMLNRPRHQPPFKMPNTAVPDSACGNRSSRYDTSRHDAVPTPFKNQGVKVTPSLFPSCHYSTGNRCTQGSREVFNLACSPDVGTTGRDASSDQDSEVVPGQTEIVCTLDFSDSPVPPILHTPGIQQILPLSQSQPHPAPGERGPVARQLKLGADGQKEEDLNSPVPPIFSTPGIQQISRTIKEPPKPSKPMGGYDPLELPKSPEMTYNLKELEAMTMSLSFRQTDLSSTFSEKSLTTSSDPDTSLSTHTTTQLPHTGRDREPGQAHTTWQRGPEKQEPNIGSVMTKRDIGPRPEPHSGNVQFREREPRQESYTGRLLATERESAQAMHIRTTSTRDRGTERREPHTGRVAPRERGQERPEPRLGDRDRTSVREPQLSAWSRQDMDSIDLPPTPELTLSYSSKPLPSTLSSSYLSTTGVDLDDNHYQTYRGSRLGPSAVNQTQNPQHTTSTGLDDDKDLYENYRGNRSVLATHQTKDWQYQTTDSQRLFNRDNQDHTRSDQFSAHTSSGLVKKSVSSAAPGSSYSSTTVLPSGDGRVLRSSENLSVVTPEVVRKLGAGLEAPPLPQQPLIHNPLTDADLSLPPTPKFFGSYHFMGSKSKH